MVEITQKANLWSGGWIGTTFFSLGITSILGFLIEEVWNSKLGTQNFDSNMMGKYLSISVIFILVFIFSARFVRRPRPRGITVACIMMVQMYAAVLLFFGLIVPSLAVKVERNNNSADFTPVAGSPLRKSP